MESRVGGVGGRYAEAAFRREASRDSIESVARRLVAGWLSRALRKVSIGSTSFTSKARRLAGTVGERMVSSGLVDSSSGSSKSSKKVSIGSTSFASRVRRLDDVFCERISSRFGCSWLRSGVRLIWMSWDGKIRQGAH